MKILILTLFLMLSQSTWAQPNQCRVATPLLPPQAIPLRDQDITGEFNCSCSGQGSCSLTISGGVAFCSGVCSGSCMFTIVVDPKLKVR